MSAFSRPESTLSKSNTKKPTGLQKPRPELSSGTQRITRGMQARAPMQQVFATAELLENVLIHLPIQNILTSQRVCRQFKDVVQTSPAIRYKLFLRVDGKGAETWKIHGRDDDDVYSLIRTTDVPDIDGDIEKEIAF
jgi:hypothetical protein